MSQVVDLAEVCFCSFVIIYFVKFQDRPRFITPRLSKGRGAAMGCRRTLLVLEMGPSRRVIDPGKP